MISYGLCIEARGCCSICSVPRERVEGPSATGEGDGSWGGISTVGAVSSKVESEASTSVLKPAFVLVAIAGIDE